MSTKLVGATAGALALVGGALVAAAPVASADPEQGSWHLWNATTDEAVVVDDELSGSAVLKLYTEINFTPWIFECRIPVGELAYTVTEDDVEPVGPEETVDLQIIPPAILSDSGSAPGQAVCQDVSNAAYGSGQNVDVTTDGLTPWILHVTTPAAPDPMDDPVYDGPVELGIDVPQNGIDFVDRTIGCWGQGPTNTGGVTVEGEYDTTSGELIPDTPQGFEAWSPDDSCVFVNTTLMAGSVVTLDPVLTLKWVPEGASS